MTANLQPYPEYKESQQAWLGRVPQHWPVLPNRAIFAEVKDREHPDEEMLSVTITRGIVRQRALLADSSKKDSSNQDKSKYKLVQPRDLAYNKMRAWQGAIGASELRGIISPAYVVMRLREDRNLPRYFHHLYRTPHFAKEAERWSYGITSDMWSLRPEHFKTIYTPQPPPEEQAAIVRYLDYANGQLGRAIAAKRKVIALLNEQKQAIIHHAVTRGLDPAVPLKPSGIPWLGDIPKHWDVLRSKYIYREVDSRSATGEETHLSMSQKLGLVPSSQVEEKRLVSESYAGAKLCKQGDLVLNRLKAHLGVFALAPQPGLVSPDYTVFRPGRELEPRYYVAVYRTPACRVELRQRAKGIVQGFWRLYTDDFYDIRMPVPPVEEQQRIMAHLDDDLSGVNATISRFEREIGLLREYRTRLVADVVTGKLDVRAAVLHLPLEEKLPTNVVNSDELKVEPSLDGKLDEEEM
jgi:type I restriction enzyme S subunit